MTASLGLPDPSEHGGDGARVAAALGRRPDDVLDLSASLNPVAPDVATMARERFGSLRRYPDPAAATAALADVLEVPLDHVLVTNGGAEAIALVGAELGGSVVEPDFSLYPRGGGPRWRSNPNNPLGQLAPDDARSEVWDEAFWQLATGTWTRGDHRRGSVVVGSLTKLFACPGLRIGYVLSHDAALLARLRAAQPAWAVNGLACEMLPSLLELADLPAWSASVAALRTELVDLLAAEGLAVRDTAGPWVLVEQAGWLRRALMPHAVVVRDCASFGLPDTVRIAVPRERELDTFAVALQRATSER